MFNSKKDLTNVLSILVFCPHDSTFLLLMKEDRGDYWIPSTKMIEKDSWKDNLQTFKKKLFDYEILSEKLLKIYKIWTLEKQYFHLIFQVNLPKEVKTNCKSQTPLGKVKWCTSSQVAKLRPKLRSLEIFEVISNYNPKIFKNSEVGFGEIAPMGTLTEVRERDIIVVPDKYENEMSKNLLESAGITIEEQCDLYENYFMHTYPCIYMNPVSFSKCISQIYFGENITGLFRAADAWKRDFLTFLDFLYLIAVMAPYTPHYGSLAEIRCRYIFRCYDEDNIGIMSYKSFLNLVTDIFLLKSPNISKAELERQLEVAARKINFKSTSFMTFDQFFQFVLQSKIPDTTLLLRLESNQCEKLLPISKRDDNASNIFNFKLSIHSLMSSNDNINGDEYKIALKTLCLKPGDNSLQRDELNLLADTMTSSVAEDFKTLSNIKLIRVGSAELECKVEELLLALKYFGSKIPETFRCTVAEYEGKEAYSWGSAYLEKLGVTLILMCEWLKECLLKERRLLEIEPPVYIMGDIHGNYHDLMCFEKAIWPNGMAMTPSNFLFLGDYVDRGIHSLEVMMYLFAHKMQNPNKLFLLRGNHEIRDIQKMFTFQRECVLKLGLTLGTSVWNAVNEVFDVMPLAAIVDHKIFCCHGGIPPPWLCPVVSVINTIPCPLVYCEKESPLAWNLMWNDPVRKTPENTYQNVELLNNEGFFPNVRRGAGYVFNSQALDRFLMTNMLSHVVRAHEVKQSGFQVHQKGKLLTVFSSSRYCEGKNYAATVLVADKLLRAFIVDTGIN